MNLHKICHDFMIYVCAKALYYEKRKFIKWLEIAQCYLFGYEWLKFHDALNIYCSECSTVVY